MPSGAKEMMILPTKGHSVYLGDVHVRHICQHKGAPKDATYISNVAHTEQDAKAWREANWKLPYFKELFWG